MTSTRAKEPRRLLLPKHRAWVKEQRRRYDSWAAVGTYQGPRSTTDRQRDIDLREAVERTLDDLVWLVDTWPPDQQNRVFTEQAIDDLVIALLHSSTSDKVKETSKTARDYGKLNKRVNRIAGILMDRGISYCVGCIKEEPFRKFFQEEALKMMGVLKYAATGSEDLTGLLRATFTLLGKKTKGNQEQER